MTTADDIRVELDDNVLERLGGLKR